VDVSSSESEQEEEFYSLLWKVTERLRAWQSHRFNAALVPVTCQRRANGQSWKARIVLLLGPDATERVQKQLAVALGAGEQLCGCNSLLVPPLSPKV